MTVVDIQVEISFDPDKPIPWDALWEVVRLLMKVADYSWPRYYLPEGVS